MPHRTDIFCPIHNDPLDPPMVFIQTWDGRDHYECPLPRCSCSISYPAAHDPLRTPDPLHPGEDPADYHDPEI